MVIGDSTHCPIVILSHMHCISEEVFAQFHFHLKPSLVDLHDDVRPLVVPRAHGERAQAGEAGEGERGQPPDLARLQRERAQARQVPKVVRPVGRVFFGGDILVIWMGNLAFY